jgi:hypothetical protein
VAKLTIKLWIISILILLGCRSSKNRLTSAIVQLCGEDVLMGYTEQSSYFPGDYILVYLDASSRQDCALGIYDVFGKLVFQTNVTIAPQAMQIDKPWENGFGYSIPAQIELPINLASGYYSIEHRIPFIVRSSSSSDITIIYPINTLNAYNPSGGKSLYTYNSTDGIAASVVSFLRPMTTTLQQEFCNSCLQWFPSLADIKANYITDIDMEEISSLSKTKIAIIIGHSEYWTRQARLNFDNFINNGGHGLILSGNTMFWQVRNSGNNTLTCFRHLLKDPDLNQDLKTIHWSDSSLHFSTLSSIGADFAHGGYGLKEDTTTENGELDQGWNGYKIVSPSSPLFEGLHFQKGDILSLPTTEYDGAPIKGFDNNGFPIVDNSILKFERMELIGFDKGWRAGKETIPTFIVIQKTKSSGIVVNVASTNWCSPTGLGSIQSGDKIKLITQNGIRKLLSGQTVFSDQSGTQ